jgi:hypothetical protein
MATNKELENIVNELSDRVSVLQEGAKAENAKPVYADGVVEESESVLEPTNNIPIPGEYRKIVDEVLNKNFGVEVNYLMNGIKFVIIVPKQYQSFNEVEKKMNIPDRRSRIINPALGANGVRDHAEKVFLSFNPEIRAKITNERF